MKYLRTPLADNERSTLHLYRRAAGRVYERVLPYASHEFKAHILRPGKSDEADLIPDGDFVALLAAFRVIHATKERTSFGRVANIIARAGNEELRNLVAQIRQDWRSVPKRPIVFDLHGEHFNPDDVLKSWMNGEVFHQDEDLIHRVDRLKDLGAMAFLVLQTTVRDLCFPILGLDNLCALALEEELRPLPDIER